MTENGHPHDPQQAMQINNAMYRQMQEQQAIEAKRMMCLQSANAIYQALALEEIRSAMDLGRDLDTGKLRKMARMSRDAAPHLLEAYGMVKVDG